MYEALAGLFGNLVSSGVNIGLTQQTNRRNEYLARLQNEWNKEQWREENLYNSPLMQMQRLRSAGINPALAYSNGIQNLAGTSPEMVSSQNNAPSFGNPFQNFANDLRQDELIRAEVDLKKSEAERNRKTLPLYDSLTGLNNVRIELGKFDLFKFKPAERALIVSKTKNIEQQTENLNEAFLGITYDNIYKGLQIDKERFYQHFFMKSDFQSTQDLRKSTMFKNYADAIETLQLMNTKMLLMRAEIFNQYSQGHKANEEAKTEANKRHYLNMESNFLHSKTLLTDVERSFKSRLYNSKDYIRYLVDGLRLNNDKLQLDIDIERGKNWFNYAHGSGYRDFSTIDSIVGTFDWSVNHLLQVAPFGFGSSQW